MVEEEDDMVRRAGTRTNPKDGLRNHAPFSLVPVLRQGSWGDTVTWDPHRKYIGHRAQTVPYYQRVCKRTGSIFTSLEMPPNDFGVQKWKNFKFFFLFLRAVFHGPYLPRLEPF